MRLAKRFATTATVVLAILLCGISGLAASDNDTIRIRRVEIVLDSVTVRVNQTRTLYAVITPRDADDQALSWQSSNWEIVTVDGEGMITGISPGRAEITATAYNGKLGRCTVTVPDTAVKSGILINDITVDDLPEATLTGKEILTAAALRADVEKAVKEAGQKQIAQVTYQNKTTISTAALRGAAFTAQSEGGSARINLQTMAKDGSLQGQMTMDPAKAPSEDADLNVRVYTDPGRIGSVYENAKARFGADATIVWLTQSDGFGMKVEVAVKVEAPAAGVEAVKLYRLADGVYTEVQGANIWMDGGGYLHFTTPYGGVFVLAAR